MNSGEQVTRHEILLPPDAPDRLLAPDAHWMSYEQNLLRAQCELGTLVTLYVPEDAPSTERLKRFGALPGLSLLHSISFRFTPTCMHPLLLDPETACTLIS